MKTKRIAIAGVTLALLFSAWGNVIAAAFCPRFRSDHHCDPNHSSKTAPTHDDIAHMDIGNERMQARDTGDVHPCHSQMAASKEAEPDTELLAVVVGSTFDPSPVTLKLSAPERDLCTHCLSHSQTTPGRTSITAGDPGKSSVESEPLLTNHLPFSASFSTEPLPNLGHGPPGELHPLYLLINVFRI